MMRNTPTRRAARRDYWNSPRAARRAHALDRAAARMTPALQWTGAILGATALMLACSINF